MSFDGVNDYVTFGPNKIGPQINGASAITMSVWAKPSAFPGVSAGARMISFQANDVTGGTMRLYDGGKIQVGGRSLYSEAYQSATATANLPLLNEWYFITGILDFANDKVYVCLLYTSRCV